MKHRRLGVGLDHDAAFTLLFRLDGTHGGRRILCREVLEIVFRQLENLVGRYVTDDDHRDVVRRVVGSVEILEVFLGPRRDVGRPADDGELVGVRDVGRGANLFHQPADVVVVDGRAALRGNDAALALDGLGVEFEVLETLGLDFEDGFERRSREPVLVDRDVVRRGGVVLAAGRFHDAVELARLQVLCAVEHHVLEKVRESGGARVTVTPAGAHEKVKRHVGNIVIRPDDDLQAVLQCDTADLGRHALHRRRQHDGAIVDERRRLREQAADDQCGQQQDGHHGDRGVEFLAGLVDDRLGLVDVDRLLEPDRRDLVDVREIQRERQADEQNQAHELLGPVRQADDRVQVMKELYDQPACDEVDQQDLEDVATP